MKTYILKYMVVNDIDFPVGTIIRSLENDPENLKSNYPYSFQVVEGNLCGEKGRIADGLSGWIIDDSAKNRELLKKFSKEKEHLNILISELNKRWESIPTL